MYWNRKKSSGLLSLMEEATNVINEQTFGIKPEYTKVTDIARPYPTDGVQREPER